MAPIRHSIVLLGRQRDFGIKVATPIRGRCILQPNKLAGALTAVPKR
jgi:hypothetical protein